MRIVFSALEAKCSKNFSGIQNVLKQWNRHVWLLIYNFYFIPNQTDHFADAFVRKNVVYSYDIVTTLWHTKVYSFRKI